MVRVNKNVLSLLDPNRNLMISIRKGDIVAVGNVYYTVTSVGNGQAKITNGSQVYSIRAGQAYFVRRPG